LPTCFETASLLPHRPSRASAEAIASPLLAELRSGRPTARPEQLTSAKPNLLSSQDFFSFVLSLPKGYILRLSKDAAVHINPERLTQRRSPA
jgi:hypothetical protein